MNIKRVAGSVFESKIQMGRDYNGRKKTSKQLSTELVDKHYSGKKSASISMAP